MDTMKISSLLIALPLLACLPCFASDAAPQRVIPTVTRTVQQFSKLENDWLDAVQKRDMDAIDKLVANDFELRTSAAPGRPTPRAESLKQSFGLAPFQSHIEQMATHEFGNVIIVSFLWTIDSTKEGTAAQKIFVVDTWKQNQDGWQVVVRYASTVAADTRNPPGDDPAEPAIKKKI